MCESGCACVCLAERERWGVTANSRPGEQGTDRGVFHLYSLRVNTNAVRAQAKLVRLRVLDVSDNKLSSLDDMLGDLKSLERLDAYKNSITAMSPQIGRISTLKELNVFNNQVPVRMFVGVAWRCGV